MAFSLICGLGVFTLLMCRDHLVEVAGGRLRFYLDESPLNILSCNSRLEELLQNVHVTCFKMCLNRCSPSFSDLVSAEAQSHENIYINKYRLVALS